MAINIGDGYGGRKHTYGYGKHTSYADKIAKHEKMHKSMIEVASVSNRTGGSSLTAIIAETASATVSKTIVGGDNIWKKIKNRLFKDDHADKNYRR